MSTADPPNNLYLIVANEGRYVLLYCCSPGLEDRVQRGHAPYFHPESEVFVIGTAAAHVPVGKLALVPEFPTYLVEALRGLPDPEPTHTLSMDLPGSRRKKRKDS